MRVYETTYIIKPDLEEEEVTQVQEKYNDIVLKADGEIINVENWGKRKLSYEIKGYDEGIYVVMKFKAPVEVAETLKNTMRIDDKLLRNIIVRLN